MPNAASNHPTQSPAPARSIHEADCIPSRQRSPSARRAADSSPLVDRGIERTNDRVREALLALGYPSLAAIDCHVASGRVILSGAVRSYHLKQMAQVVALRVAGPGRVDNRVVVTSL
ncbi:BON domain-containing protein [Lacipirellula limnantheis]|uniref:BON domain-containing protein n=1 Tax=Lacipirellula limnantheis TaxID=2528024 RepID=UPI0011A113DE|nr:BON domain-containing protein [Lacipirellula limnantheis]